MRNPDALMKRLLHGKVQSGIGRNKVKAQW
jgi:hypothetical protein